MSGPKGSSIVIDEPTMLEAWDNEKKIESELKKELSILQNIETPTDEQLQRIVELADALSRRSAVLEAVKELEKRAIINQYTSLISNFNQDMSRINATLSEHYPTLKLQEPPKMPPTLDLTMLFDDVQAAFNTTQARIIEYQKEVDALVHQYRQSRIANDGFERTMNLASNFSNSSLKSAKQIISALENDALFINQERADNLIKKIIDHAKDMLLELDMPEDLPLMNETTLALDLLLDEKNIHEAELKKESFRLCLKKENERKEQHETEINQRNENQKRLMVGSIVTRTLEDLGYTVSDIQDTAFVNNGELFAVSRNHTDHVIKLKLSPKGESIQTWPMRVAENGHQITKESLEEDQNFDNDLCNNVRTKFKKSLEAKGLKLGDANQLPTHGQPNVQVVLEHQLSERINNKRRLFKSNNRIQANKQPKARKR